jgi:crotonobetaine/carnitine-CoA ligase
MVTTESATVAARLRARVEEDPERDFAACGGEWMSAGRVRDRARRLATGLHGLGVQPGDRVASIMPNRDESVELFFACAELGAIQVPLNVFLKGAFLRYQLVDAAPRVVVVDSAALRALEAVLDAPELSTCTVVALDEAVGDVVRFADLFVDEAQTWPDPGPDDLMCVLYTSGTTGLPKGCMINNGYLVHMPKAHIMHEWFKPADTSFCPLPLYHGFALSALMDALVAGCRVAFDPVFTASGALDRARELGATQLFGVGAMAVAMLATPATPRDAEHLLERCIFVPVAPHIQKQFEERFDVQVFCEGYGQTEVLPATMGVTRTGRDKPSAGKALPWLDVQVVDDADGVLPVGQPGEIVVRPLEPHSMFAGYWRKERETLVAWRNLWHHTGDLGYFDAEGMLYFVDRKKDALRRRGENVSSVELELAIVRHPAIAQVAVHATPSELSEDEIKACLVLESGATVTPEELFEYFRTHLPYYAVPRYVEVVDQLPVTITGRVQKHILRERWNSPDTIDFQALGLVLDRTSRR